MIIHIEFHSIWNNSFLDGSNDEYVNKKRKFKSSSKSKEAVDVREITKNTIIGVQCRLIGDQRKLYQAREANDFYFADIQDKISFKFLDGYTFWNELVSIINKNEYRPIQKSFLGCIPDYVPLFDSKFSATLWSVLDFSLQELLNFLKSPECPVLYGGTVDPIYIINKFVYDVSDMREIKYIDKEISYIKNSIEDVKKNMREVEDKVKNGGDDKNNKSQLNKLARKLNRFNEELDEVNKKKDDAAYMEFEEKVISAVATLEAKFHGVEYAKEGKVYPSSLYAGALYLMADLLMERYPDANELLNKNGLIQGFSKKNFNGTRDFLNALAGGKRQTTHTPADIRKSSGSLAIILDISLERAIDLKEKIQCAGVSSFYLGKKGLAYISRIDVR